MARRQRPSRNIKPVYYVFCEGETEEEYVKFLKRYYRIPIEINSKIRNRISDSYIRRYKRGKPSHPNDITFVMYDLDKADTREQILALDAELLCSNPCIELWFLLHYKNQTANISTRDVLRAFLLKYPNYEKGKNDSRLFERLLERKETAISRAKVLPESSNPSTGIYKLIELLESQRNT